MKRSKLFAIVLLVLMCANFISCTGEPVETQGTLATDSSASELSTLELTEETSVDSTELENTTKTTETTKTESSASETEPEITTASSAQSDIPITMAGAVDKPPAYELLQNEAGGYIGVRFTYEDGSTYTWECPVESVVPPIVIFDFNYAYTDGVREKEIVLNEICLIEYATAEEGLFDRVNWQSREVIYRHQNEEGKKYTYGTGGCCHESGQIRFDEQGNLIYWGVDSPYDTYFKTRMGKVREVRPLKPGGSVPETPEFTEWVGGVPESWWEEDGRFYGILNVTDWPTGLRMSGYDVLYYSEEPIENFTEEMARDFFPDMVKQEYCAKMDGSSDVLCEIREFTHGFTFFYAICGEYPPLADDPISEETWLYYIRVDIIQISPHYFSKIETYNYDDHAVYDMTMGTAASMIYY